MVVMRQLRLEICIARSISCARWLLVLVVALFVSAKPAWPATQSALFARGYTVVPAPQQVTLRKAEFRIDSTWHIVLGKTVPHDNVAVEVLKEELKARFDLTLRDSSPTEGNSILLDIEPG